MIPPRPWKVIYKAVHDADGMPIFGIGTGRQLPDRELADHIIRAVNAEPEIVAALEAAERLAELVRTPDVLYKVRAALAKVRGG